MLRNSSLENPAFSDARDSVVQARDPLTGNTKLYYYGDVKVKYSSRRKICQEKAKNQKKRNNMNVFPQTKVFTKFAIIYKCNT